MVTCLMFIFNKKNYKILTTFIFKESKLMSFNLKYLKKVNEGYLILDIYKKQ